MFSRGCSVDVPDCVMNGSVLPAGDIGKCLGFWWKGDLDQLMRTSRKRGEPFHFNIGAFQGDLSPEPKIGG